MVHPRYFSMLIQAARGNLGVLFFNRLCLLGQRQWPVIGPWPSAAVERELSLVPEPLPGKPSSGLLYCRPDRGLCPCRQSLRLRPRPGAFTPASIFFPCTLLIKLINSQFLLLLRTLFSATHNRVPTRTLFSVTHNRAPTNFVQNDFFCQVPSLSLLICS
jgi:hypothetical protein